MSDREPESAFLGFLGVMSKVVTYPFLIVILPVVGPIWLIRWSWDRARKRPLLNRWYETY